MSLLCIATPRLAAADYVSSGDTAIDFPYQPPPQYAVVDMGNGDIVDMNDSGQLLLSFWSDDTESYIYKLWSAGATTNITATSGNYTYSWLSLANNGTALGFYYDETDDDYGFVSWTAGGGASRVSYASAVSGHVSGTITTINWSDSPLITRNALYSPVTATTHTVLGTDADDNPYGYDNSFTMLLCLNANGTVTKVGDTVFNGGALSPSGSISIPYGLASDAATDTLTMTFSASYTSETEYICYLSGYEYDPDDDEDDIPVYDSASYTHTYLDWDTFDGNLALNGHGLTNPEGYPGYGIWPPWNAYPDYGFFYATIPVVANIGGTPVLLNPYYGDEGTSVNTIVSGAVASA